MTRRYKTGRSVRRDNHFRDIVEMRRGFREIRELLGMEKATPIEDIVEEIRRLTGKEKPDGKDSSPD